MKKEPLVSIIMPSYNRHKIISKSINSVIRQTYKNWELIIVDDCIRRIHLKPAPLQPFDILTVMRADVIEEMRPVFKHP